MRHFETLLGDGFYSFNQMVIFCPRDACESRQGLVAPLRSIPSDSNLRCYETPDACLGKYKIEAFVPWQVYFQFEGN